MKVEALDHINIATRDLAGTARFYADLLSLDVRDGPPPFAPDQVQWLSDDAGRPVIHVNKVGMFERFGRVTRPGGTTGAIHHVAFACTGHAEMIDRLKARELDYALNEVGSIGLRQIFVTDPNGILLELNFRES